MIEAIGMANYERRGPDRVQKAADRKCEIKTENYRDEFPSRHVAVDRLIC